MYTADSLNSDWEPPRTDRFSTPKHVERPPDVSLGLHVIGSSRAWVLQHGTFLLYLIVAVQKKFEGSSRRDFGTLVGGLLEGK